MYVRISLLVFLMVFLSGCANYSQGDLMRQERAFEEIQSRVAAQHDRIEELRNDLDQVQASLEQLRKEAAQRLMDLEFRLEPGASYPGPRPGQEASRPEDQDKKAISQEIPRALKKIEPDADKPVIADDPGNAEKALYDKALALYYAEQPEQARKQFRIFIDEYPESQLVPNAWYWIAEAHYTEKDFPRAILGFRQVLEKFPEDPKAPDALLKIGYSYERLNDFRNALFYLRVLTQDYPDSSAARKASDLIPELRNKV